MLGSLAKDRVTLIKNDGTTIDNIKALVQPNMIFIEDASLPIEEGDYLIRALKNGLQERYLVLDRGFYDDFAGVKAHYQVKVRKETAIELERKSAMQINIGTAYGSNIGTQGDASITNTFNFEKVDQLIEVHGGEDKEELRKMIAEIKELFEDSEKVKKGALEKYSEKLEKHSWITGAIAQMALQFLTSK